MNFSIIEIKEIVATVSMYKNMDYSGYGISFMKRRLTNIFEMYNIRKISQFYELIKEDYTRDRVIGEIFVEATEMFRDPSFWRFLRDNVLKTIPTDTTIWFPSETSGHEILSLAIMLKEMNLNDDIKIICNNPTNYCCNNIRKGILKTTNFEINHSNYKRLENLDLFENYFTKDTNCYTAVKELTDSILCKQTDFTNAIEDDKIALIFARNQALCFNHSFSAQYFKMLHEKLMPGGYIAIGIKEKMPTSTADKMNVISETEKIFQKF